MPPKASSSKRKDEVKDEDSARCVEYNDLQERDKFVLDLNTDLLDLRYRFINGMAFLRRKGSEEGCVINGIPEVRCINGFPLVEIKITYKNISTSFLISKASLYVVGYSYQGLWYCFSDAEIKVVGSQILTQSSKYNVSVCKGFGAKEMLRGLLKMQEDKLDERREGSIIYFVHLAEAARFRPIENQVILGICSGGYSDFDLIPDLEQIPFTWVGAGNNLGEHNDIMTLIKPEYSTNFNFGVAPFNFVNDLVRSWSGLSEAWVAYNATGSMEFVESCMGDVLRKCHIRNLHSLKSTLGLLCCVNFKEVISKEQKWLRGEGRHQQSRAIVKVTDWEEERCQRALPKCESKLRKVKGVHMGR